MKLKFNFNKRNRYKNICSIEGCSCLRGIRLEDVTVELEKEAYEEMRHNK